MRGALDRSARQHQGSSQAALAGRAGVSRQWIVEFEQGKARAEFIMFLRVLDALELELTAAPAGEAGVSPVANQAREDGSGPVVVDLDTLLDEHLHSEPAND